MYDLLLQVLAFTDGYTVCMIYCYRCWHLQMVTVYDLLLQVLAFTDGHTVYDLLLQVLAFTEGHTVHDLLLQVLAFTDGHTVCMIYCYRCWRLQMVTQCA